MSKIVEWANYGEHISLKCKKCGALFSTKNIIRIGARSIFPWSYYDEGFTKSIECDVLGHTAEDLEPFEEAYINEKEEAEKYNNG